MKIILISLMVLLLSSITWAAKKNGTNTGKALTKSSNDTGSHLSTDVNFEDQLVDGKYAYPDEAIATVEDEKLLNDLLSVRKNFKDRLKQTATRN